MDIPYEWRDPRYHSEEKTLTIKANEGLDQTILNDGVVIKNRRAVTV